MIHFPMVLVILALFAADASAQVLRASYHRPESTPGARALEAFGTALSGCSDDALTVEVFPNSTLAGAGQVAGQVVRGEIELAIVPSQALQEVDPTLALLSAPLVFNNRRHWEAALTETTFGVIQE